MEQIKFTGIVIKSLDYKEKDKLLTIFCLELGKVTATLKGVKQEKAKLKFAGMPFCFAEFVASKKGEYLTITECYQIESFFNIVSDYNKSLVGFLMLEITCIIMQQMPNEEWFLFLIKMLKTLEYGEVNEKIIQTKFVLETLKSLGYGLSFGSCAECGLKFLNDVYINLEMGELQCSTCKNGLSTKLTKQQFAVLRLVNESQLNKLGTLKMQSVVLNEVNNLLIKNLNLRLGVKLKSAI